MALYVMLYVFQSGGLIFTRRAFLFGVMDKAAHDKFYKSKAWQACRAAYMQNVGGLCERCLAKGLIVPAEIVHHKQYLDENTVKMPEIALNHDNLEALCFKCHNSEHFGTVKTGKRYKFEGGRIVF